MTRRSDRWRLGLCLVGALLLIRCGGGTPTPVPRARETGPPVAEAERIFLVDPFEGYEPAVDETRLETVRSAHRGLLETQDIDSANRVARELLGVDPAFEPAVVLAGQAQFVAGDFEGVLRQLAPIVEEKPSHRSARLVLARAMERLGDLLGAYAVYRGEEPLSPVSSLRAAELRPRVLEVLSHRLEQHSGAGDFAGVASELRWLERWEPDSTEAFEARRLLARSEQNSKAELAALRELTARMAERLDLVSRRAELELQVGDAGEAVTLLRGLSEQQPGDKDVAARLEVAKFRWRLSMLPEGVKSLASRTSISRAGFATLLYWLVPEVRYGRPRGAKIAADILDHSSREEIARVVNLGLMEVDSALHLFNPGATVTRSQALKALVAAAALKTPRPGCLGGPGSSPCDQAVQCGWVESVELCQGRQGLTGGEAVDWIERFVAKS